jgi:hypothetical protein
MHPFMYAMMNRVRFDAERGGDPGVPVTTPQPAPAQVPSPQQPATFSREYVTELREEAKNYRLKADEAKRAAEEAAAAAAKATADAEAAKAAAAAEAAAAKAAAEQAANDRIIRAELKAEAIKAGMVDLDGLKLADLTAVKLDEQGNVTGAAEMLAALKESKPYLFTAAPVHSSQPTPPPPAPDKVPAKSAREMTRDEYEAAKRAAIAAAR